MPKGGSELGLYIDHGTVGMPAFFQLEREQRVVVVTQKPPTVP
jgi:hypothetical protein